MDRDIQPRTVPEILDAGFRLYRRHFTLLLAISFATTVPLPDSERLALRMKSADLGLVSALLMPTLVTLVLSTLKGWLVTAVLTEPLLGHPASLKAALDRLLPALPSLVLRSMGFGLLLCLGTLAFLVPAVLLYLAWFLYSQVVIVEGRGVPAFRRSAELTKGQRGRLGILMTLMSLLVGSLSLSFSLSGQLLHFQLADQVFTYFSILLLGPLQSTILLVAYFDLRARREGLDLKLRSEALGGRAEVGAA